MNKANKNNETKYICLLCIQPYEEPPPVMALIGCKRSSRTAPPPKKHQKVAPLRTILLYFFIVAPGRCHPFFLGLFCFETLKSGPLKR